MHDQTTVFLSGDEIFAECIQRVVLTVGMLLKFSFIILEPKIKMYIYSSVRNKLVLVF